MPEPAWRRPVATARLRSLLCSDCFFMRFYNLSRHTDIGSNSYMLELGDTRIILDAGTHPKHTGKTTLPDYESLAPHSIDGIIISHPHLDHIGGLPVVAARQPDAAVVMTEPTKASGIALLHNSVNVMKSQREELNEKDYPLYSHKEIDRLEDKWMTRAFEEPFSLGETDRVECTFFRAGHVYGAAGVRIKAGGKTIFYTGDVHFEDQTLTKAANFPSDPVDVLIMETTRGDHPRDPGYTRAKEKRRLGDTITETLARGGSIMIPVFAFGKTQELLLMLHELREEGVIPSVPVHIGGLSTRMTEIADDFADEPDRNHRGYYLLDDFPELKILPRGQRDPAFHTGRIYALSSGMMSENTVSHRFARRVLGSPEHALLFVGYADPDSPAGRILTAGTGGKVQLVDKIKHDTEIKCQVERFDFSGHATRDQLVEYAVSVSPKHIFLVHGDPPAKAWFVEELGKRLPQTKVMICPPGGSCEF